MGITDSARQWMHALARLRGQVVRMRTNDSASVADALELADEALQLIDTLRAECATLEKRCSALDAKVREMEADTHAVLELVPTPLIVTDRSGVIVDANHAAASVLGRSTPRLREELLLHFFDDRAAFAELVRSMPAPEKQVRTNLKLRPRERAPIDVEITLTPDPRQNDARWLWFLSQADSRAGRARRNLRPVDEPGPFLPDAS